MGKERERDYENFVIGLCLNKKQFGFDSTQKKLLILSYVHTTYVCSFFPFFLAIVFQLFRRREKSLKINNIRLAGQLYYYYLE
jgi:hypothetical protein